MAKRFVCVRIQSMNGVNLEHFQFEYDLTWMSFLQNAEGRTYVRYGGREDHDPESHLNKESLLRVMRLALDLHHSGQVQPENRYEPVPHSVRTPEDIPTMKAMLAKRKENCIHCHDVKLARLQHLRDSGQLDKTLVFTYPSPSRLGLHLDSVDQSLVARVSPDSPAASAGIRAGDRLVSAEGQRVLTFADLTRVLELAPAAGELRVETERAGQRLSATVPLPAGWRKNDDASWRSSTGVLGPSSGFWGADASSEQRRQLGIAEDAMAVRVTFMWGAWVKSTGLRLGDVVVGIDGQKSRMTIRQLQAYLHLNRNWGDRVELTVRRGDEQLKMSVQFPAQPPE